jgi:hypothetical protein
LLPASELVGFDGEGEPAEPLVPALRPANPALPASSTVPPGATVRSSAFGSFGVLFLPLVHSHFSQT